jgi:hypothetical protein
MHQNEISLDISYSYLIDPHFSLEEYHNERGNTMNGSFNLANYQVRSSALNEVTTESEISGSFPAR